MEVVYKLAESNEEIKNWVEANGGTPAIIDDPEVTEDQTGLRIDWRGNKDESMLSEGREVTRDITWEEFFREMDDRSLAFMYSDDEEVNPTWRYKFVNKYPEEE
jgi:hypothetical protein